MLETGRPHKEIHMFHAHSCHSFRNNLGLPHGLCHFSACVLESHGSFIEN